MKLMKLEVIFWSVTNSVARIDSFFCVVKMEFILVLNTVNELLLAKASIKITVATEFCIEVLKDILKMRCMLFMNQVRMITILYTLTYQDVQEIMDSSHALSYFNLLWMPYHVL